MPKLNTYSVPSLNLKLSPFLQQTGAVLRALNVERDSIGGYKKRPGYNTFLGTPDNSQVNTLFSWVQNDGVSNFVYRTSGSALYHSIAGTGDWTLSGNGTITNGGHFGHAVLDNTLIGGDGTTPTRHTTNGTGFSDTTGAPLAEHWEDYQGRVWAARGTAVSGTNTDMFYSTVGTATDWTTDASSIRIPGPGRVNSLFKAYDRLQVSKDGGNMFRWDGYSLIDLATNVGPSSPYSIGNLEDFRVYLNREGYFGYSGAKPTIISNPIERQIYNNSGSAIAGTTFDNAPGINNRYHYMCSVGTITDDLVGVTIPDAIHRYNFQLDEWTNWQFADRPTAFGTYQDINSNEQVIFGDATGQCYQLSGTALSDNGKPIEVQLMGFIHGGSLDDKKWNYITGVFNPGCRAKMAIALSDTFSPRTLNWQEIGDAIDGVVDYRFPAGSRGKFCFWKIYENSKSTPFQLYAVEFDAVEIPHG
jgi:hypothetical protein